jgi:hypothetical protein
MPAADTHLPRFPLLFAGDFETHLTVHADQEADCGRLAAFAEKLGARFTHIVLDRGSVPSQPMLTVPGRGTTLPAQAEAAVALSGDLAEAGFTVTRVKMEAAPWNDDVPADDAAAARLDGALHFEHHVKVVLEPGSRRDELAALIAPFGARLSRNARRHRRDGKAEWFATQRCYQAGLATAGARLAALTGALEHAGCPPAEAEREYVVYDSAPSTDAGWLNREGAAG